MQLSNRPERGARDVRLAASRRERALDRGAQLALVRASGSAVEVGVAEALVLHVGDQAGLVEMVELDGVQPGAQQATRICRRDRAARVVRTVARIALAEQALAPC